ncbi:MAG: hypothetical protein ACT4O3_09075 [Elusimicrobiota bacterium]
MNGILIREGVKAAEIDPVPCALKAHEADAAGQRQPPNGLPYVPLDFIVPVNVEDVNDDWALGIFRPMHIPDCPVRHDQMGKPGE